MASTGFAAVKAALVEGLQALEDLNGVQVEYGWPGDDLVERERVFCGQARFAHEPASMRAGRVYRNEQGELDVIVDVESVGGSAQDADLRAVAIGAVVEEFVADNPNLGNDTAGGVTVNAVTMRGGAVLNAYNDRGALSRITYTLRWDARLT